MLMRNKFKDELMDQNILDITPDEIKKKFKKYGSLDPFPSIEPSLLNSADIYDYVEKTGMIFPFYPENLKPASYGIRMGGEFVYWENREKKVEGRLEDIEEKDSDGDIVFTLKRNSIAFVGLEPVFRFPDYIAGRFNLKVKHVYQGLLLGTGPLVDPGFQGKVFIPLHNFTCNDYKLKIKKPLIYMEFTKLSINKRWAPNIQPENERKGQYIPFISEKLLKKWKLNDYLTEAYNGPILSTIQGLQSQIDKSLGESEKLNDKATNQLRLFNIFIIASLIAVLMTLGLTIYQTISIHNKTLDYLKLSDERQNAEYEKIVNQKIDYLDLKSLIIDLSKKIEEQKSEIEDLKKSKK